MKQNLIILSFLLNCLKFKNNKGPGKVLFIAFLWAFSFYSVNAQIVRKSTVTFYSTDSVVVTADHYRSKEGNPYIILLHQENSSRGVFDSIAERFVKMNYNCLAVDLRNGNKYDFVNNETAQIARQQNRLINQITAENDLEAAINFIYGISRQKFIILGSSSSASMALKMAAGNDNVEAVIALSPGEFYRPELELKTIIKDLKKPLFIAGNQEETNYYQSILAECDSQITSLFKPSVINSLRGNELLLSSNNLQNEYWFALLIFIKSLHS